MEAIIRGMTDRAREAVRLRATGLTYAEIARVAGYSDRRAAFQAIKRYKGPVEPEAAEQSVQTVVALLRGNVCPRCGCRSLVRDGEGPYCLHCAWRTGETLLPMVRGGVRLPMGGAG